MLPSDELLLYFSLQIDCVIVISFYSLKNLTFSIIHKNDESLVMPYYSVSKLFFYLLKRVSFVRVDHSVILEKTYDIVSHALYKFKYQDHKYVLI